MSLFQTLVLLMFNEGEEFTLEEIKLATGIGSLSYPSRLSFHQRRASFLFTLACLLVRRGQRTASDLAVARVRKSTGAHQNPQEQRRGGRGQVLLQR